MLDKEFRYYLDNQNDLVKKYKGKFIVIINEKVVGSYDSHGEAYETAIKSYELGSFLIQHCLPGEESYSHTFYSRVSL